MCRCSCWQIISQTIRSVYFILRQRTQASRRSIVATYAAAHARRRDRRSLLRACAWACCGAARSQYLRPHMPRRFAHRWTRPHGQPCCAWPLDTDADYEAAHKPRCRNALCHAARLGRSSQDSYALRVLHRRATYTRVRKNTRNPICTATSRRISTVAQSPAICAVICAHWPWRSRVS